MNEPQQVVREKKNYSAPLQNISPKPPSNIIFAVILGIIIFFIAGIISFFMMSKSSDEDVSFFNTHKFIPTINQTYAFVGNKGAVIWIISKNSSLKDSIHYELLIVDPLKKSTKKELIISSESKMNELKDDTKKIFTNLLQYDDLAYSVGEDIDFVAYNIYTGSVELNRQLLIKKYEVLKNGILKVEDLPGENGFKVTSADGEVFRFDPYTKKLISKQEKASTKNKEKIHTQLYLTNGLKHQLYLFTKKGSGFPLVSGSFIEESDTERATGPKGRNVKDIFGNINLEKVSDRSFFRAQPLLRDSAGNLVLFYKSDLSANATIILESISADGKTNWTLQNPSFTHITQGDTEDIKCIYTFSPTLLILSLYTDQQLYIGIDVKSGKILWNFYPQKYANENPVFDN